jgi:tripartite-type tricarboxylate transporter receptor subunit TctC
MRPARTLAHIAVALTAAFGLGVGTAEAQKWPERPITIVSCFPAGGGTDIAARLYNIPLGEALGQPVIIENRAGASGNVGISYVQRAAPDGYTLLACSSAYVVNPSMFASATYDPIKDFEPVMVVGASPNIFTVPASSPHKTMKEFLDWAQANPGKANWTTPGKGTTPYLGGEHMIQQLKLQMAYVPFTGAGPATQAAIAGQVDLYSANLGSVAPLVAGGQLRAVAMTSEKRWHELPQVPTLVELGIKDAVSDTFQALWYPAGTPKEMIDKVSTALGKILTTPEMKAKFDNVGLPVLAEASPEFKKRIVREVAFYKDIIDRGGLKVK